MMCVVCVTLSVTGKIQTNCYTSIVQAVLVLKNVRTD